MRLTWIRTLTTLVAATALTAGCTGGDDPDSPPDGDGDARMVEHRYGHTEVPEESERVVSLGRTDADPLLALGVQPVAVRPGYGVSGVGPWAQGRLEGAQPEILDPGEIDLDEVRALNPDLIVAISASVNQRTYAQLSKIAPTVVQPEGSVDYGTSWEVATTMIGNALDKVDEAKEVIEETKVAISDTLRKHPRIDGTTGAMVEPRQQGGWSVYTPVASQGQFLFELGVNPPPKLANRDDGTGLQFAVERQSTNDLEADVLLAAGAPAQQQVFTKNKAFQRLAVKRRGGVVRVPHKPLGQALAYTTVLSIPYALDRLAPKLTEALD